MRLYYSKETKIEEIKLWTETTYESETTKTSFKETTSYDIRHRKMSTLEEGELTPKEEWMELTWIKMRTSSKMAKSTTVT